MLALVYTKPSANSPPMKSISHHSYRFYRIDLNNDDDDDMGTLWIVACFRYQSFFYI